MCMILATPLQKVKRVALTNKIVYKVMKCSEDDALGRLSDSRVVVSPYQNHPYVLGEMQRANIEKVTQRSGVLINNGIHAFTTIADAINDASTILWSMYHSIGIYECVIPRFAVYYSGYWEYKYPKVKIANIVSSKLTVVRKIHDIK